MSLVQITYTRTWENKPLVVLDRGPFRGAECTPERLRALAKMLEATAVVAESRPCTGRYWKPGFEECEI